jgi:HD-GYP domain-containing protein (c-di-GMP phosphodiesterase class II)
MIPSTSSRVRIPVRAKITAPFLLIALAMAALAAFVLFQLVFENIDQRFNTQLAENGKLAAEWMVQEENARLANLRLLAHTTGAGDALQAGDAEALRKATLGSTIGHQEDAVEFLDTEGKLVLSMRHRAGSMYVEDYVLSTADTVDYRQWSFVEQVLNKRSDAMGDKFSGLARAPWGDFFYVSGPVYDSAHRLAGVILVGEGLSTLVRKMRMDVGSQFTIYDLNGQPIASTSAQVVSILTRQSTGSLRRDRVDGRKLTFNAIDYGEILGPWKLRGSQDLGLIGTAIPKDFLLRASMPIRIQLAVLVGLAFLLVIAMGGMIADRITRPLVALVKASKEVAHGNLGVNVSCQSNDEIADLTDHFNHMAVSVQDFHRDILKAYDNTLEGWSRATDLRDNETERHMRNVVDLTLRLASRMGYPDDQLVTFYRGALLHDVGKIGVADAVLKKPGKLTEEERAEMQRHTQYAYELLSPIDYLGSALLIPYYHHERWDGTGYPIGLKGEEIPESARIFAIVDVWDAMTSDRVYRKAMHQDEVVQYILDNRGTHFDPRVVDTFLAMIGKADLPSGAQIHG